MKVAVLFCHSDEQAPNEVAEKELDRQYKLLSQYANEHGFELEHLFCHVGELDYEHPDDVLLRFLRGLQNSRSSIVIAETRDYFPDSQMRFIPPVQACFLKEHIQQVEIGSRQRPLSIEKEALSGQTYLYSKKKKEKTVEIR